MSEPTSARRKRLLLRSRYRGFKEADILFARFVERYLDGLDDDELGQFEALLDEPDQDVYGWVMGRIDVPERHKNSVFDRLRTPNIQVE